MSKHTLTLTNESGESVTIPAVNPCAADGMGLKGWRHLRAALGCGANDRIQKVDVSGTTEPRPGVFVRTWAILVSEVVEGEGPAPADGWCAMSGSRWWRESGKVSRVDCKLVSDYSPGN